MYILIISYIYIIIHMSLSNLPIKIINEILCYVIDNLNYMDIMLLSKDIRNYFKQYCEEIIRNNKILYLH